MDYGGHDSVFEDNLVMAAGRKACIGMGSFNPGHGDIVRNNKCLVGLDIMGDVVESPPAVTLRLEQDRLVSQTKDYVAGVERCQDGNALITNNSYFTPHGNASYTCGDIEGDSELLLSRVQEEFKMEKGSTTDKLPPMDVMVGWAKSLLMERDDVEEVY